MKKALLYSGGVESTYLYLSMLDEEVDVYVIERNNCTANDVAELFESISTMFCNDSNVFLLEYPDVENYKRVVYALRELSTKYDEVIFGYNKEPEHLERNDTFKRVWDDIPNVKTPLEHMYKWEVIQKYYDEKIDDVLSITVTCGVKGSTPCGECYPCKERAWAYEKLGLPVNLGSTYL